MSAPGSAAVERARALIGTRFRPQGRSAATGIDCVGLVLCAHRLPVAAVARDYALRGVADEVILAGLEPWFRRVARTRVRPGDVMLLRVAGDGLHLGIASEAGLIHADLRHGVVERPGAMPWPMIGVFRRRTRSGGKG